MLRTVIATKLGILPHKRSDLNSAPQELGETKVGGLDKQSGNPLNTDVGKSGREG